MTPYKYGLEPSKEQISNALDVLKCERVARWQSMMSDEEKEEIDSAHNVSIYLLRKILNEKNAG